VVGHQLEKDGEAGMDGRKHRRGCLRRPQPTTGSGERRELT